MDHVHARYLLIKNKSTGADPLVDKILSEKEEDKPTKALYQRARSIYLSDTKRAYVEACLIASRDLGKIFEIIEVPVEVLYMYQEIFFNVVDYDKLSLLELVDQAASPIERNMKVWALAEGLDFIAFRLGKTVNINPVEGLQELFAMSIYKSKEAVYSSSSGDTVKWTKLSLEIARILKAWVLDSGAARKDIELALMEVIPDFRGFDSLDQL